MFRLSPQARKRPIYAVPYRNCRAGKPVLIAPGTVVHRSDCSIALEHMPRAKPIPLRLEHPGKAGIFIPLAGDRFLFRLPTGGPALIYGARSEELADDDAIVGDPAGWRSRVRDEARKTFDIIYLGRFRRTQSSIRDAVIRSARSAIDGKLLSDFVNNDPSGVMIQFVDHFMDIFDHYCPARSDPMVAESIMVEVQRAIA
jgi:hypothetical protein